MGLIIQNGIQYGTQPDISGKVDKVAGKGLSTEDYTTAEKEKLQGIAAGAQVNSVTGVKGSAESTYRTGDVNLTAANVGLGNVDNTSDANKPISTATRAALDVLPCLVVNCGTLSSLPTTISNAGITADMVVASADVGNPAAQGANDWQAVCVDGAVTISGTIAGVTALTLYLMKSRTT